MPTPPCRYILFEWIDPETKDEEDLSVRDPHGFPDIGEIVTLNTDDKTIYGAVLTRGWDYYDPEATRLSRDEWGCTIVLSPVTVINKTTDSPPNTLQAIDAEINKVLDAEFGNA